MPNSPNMNRSKSKASLPVAKRPAGNLSGQPDKGQAAHQGDRLVRELERDEQRRPGAGGKR
jgi:hypothetical protein